jgi:hypothetical protein
MKRQLDKELRQTIEKRNKRLEAFFELLGLDTDIVGDMETPAVILNNECLSCYVHNFSLVFTDHYQQGKELYRIKLQKDQVYDPQIITNWLKTATHRIIYRVKMASYDLYVVGYNQKSEDETKGKFPVFGKYGSKIFFTQEYAQNIIDLYDLSSFCEII